MILVAEATQRRYLLFITKLITTINQHLSYRGREGRIFNVLGMHTGRRLFMCSLHGRMKRFAALIQEREGNPGATSLPLMLLATLRRRKDYTAKRNLKAPRADQGWGRRNGSLSNSIFLMITSIAKSSNQGASLLSFFQIRSNLSNQEGKIRSPEFSKSGKRWPNFVPNQEESGTGRIHLGSGKNSQTGPHAQAGRRREREKNLFYLISYYNWTESNLSLIWSDWIAWST